MLPRVVIIPGCGVTNVLVANWYFFMKQQLESSGKFSNVILNNMPDPIDAHESVWLPYLRKEIGIDENTIIIGHSSGAEAAMRLLETDRVLGMVLVAACHTDLGIEHERIAGYYSRPWEWEKIKSNAKWILQFHSEDDPFIPRDEADHVAASLLLVEGREYFCYKDHMHFFGPDDVLPVIEQLFQKLS
eukprot:gene8492-17509_t